MQHFKRYFFIIGLFIIGQTTIAQIDEFKLSDYKLPDLKRHQLDLRVNSNSSIRKDDNISSFTENDYSNFSGNFSANYKFYRNSRSYQGGQYIGWGSNYYFSKQKSISIQSLTSTDTRNYWHLRSDGNIRSENRFYLSDKNFIEVQLLSQFTINNSKQNSEYQDEFGDIHQDSEYQEKTNYTAVILPLYYGGGRIEQVQDARQSLFILNQMQKVNRLQRAPSHDEIITMSEKISEVKNKRFFDSRLQKIDELDTINKFLTENGLITDTDITYFSTLNDMWDYGDLQIRQAGYRIYFGAEPMLDFVNFQDIQIDKLQDTTLNMEENTQFRSRRLYFTVGYAYENPFSQKWQFSLNSSIKGGPATYIMEKEYLQPTTISSNSKVNNTEFLLQLNTGLGFYPNTRSYISASIEGHYSKAKGTYFMDETENDSDSKSIFLISNLNGYYYISPKFRFGANLSYSLTDYKGENAIDNNRSSSYSYYPQYGWNMITGDYEYKRSYLNFQLTLSYSIF